MVAYVCNPNTQDMEEGRAVIQGLLKQQAVLEESLPVREKRKWRGGGKEGERKGGQYKCCQKGRIFSRQYSEVKNCLYQSLLPT